MAGRFSVEAVFKAVDRVTAPVRRIQKNVSKMQKGINSGFKAIDNTVGKMGEGVRQAGATAAIGLGLTSAALTKVIRTGATFEQSIVNAAAKFPGQIRKGTAAFTQLSDAAREVGATTEFTATQAAEALNFLAMAGFDAKASVAALPGVVDLATAAQLDLATATDVASDTLGAFGLATKDATQLGINLARVNDVLAKTATTSNTTVTQMFEALRKGGPVATAAGSNLETVSAMIGVMANAGIKAEVAGTAIANGFLNLTTPTSDAARVMRMLGIDTRDARGELLDMPDIIDNINAATKDLTKAQRLSVIESIFGREGLAGTANVIAAGGEQLRQYREQLENSTGAATDMATIMRTTVEGSLKSLGSAVESVMISLFDMQSGPLKDTIDTMTDWVRANEKLIAQNLSEVINDIITNFDDIVTVAQNVVKFTAAFVALTVAVKAGQLAIMLFNGAILTVNATIALGRAAIIAYTAVVKGMPAALAAARVAMLALNIAFNANPIGLMITAVGTLVGLAGGIMVAWGPVADFFEDLWKKITGVVTGAASALRSVGSFIGLIDEEQPAPGAAGAPGMQVLSSQERSNDAVMEAVRVNETRQTAEVVIRDETGRAEMNTEGATPGLKLQLSGGF